MLDSETQRKIHELENELLVVEEEKRHLLADMNKLHQDERILENTIIRAEKNLELDKDKEARDAERLREAEEKIQRLRILIKNQRN